uniref:Metalloendopeptidase n=1 Tax=Parasteatoda tepidariorum TaxID=114398 RepID=A0A2L2XWU1_PARTP
MKLVLLISCVLASVLAEEAPEYIQLSTEETETARRALENPDLYDGDIAGINPKDPGERSAIVGNKFRWPGGDVPYVIDRSLVNAANLIQQGIADYHRYTCLKFKQRTYENNFIRIFA